jgi:hypothetical protein
MLDFLKDRDTAELVFFWAGVLMPITAIGAIIYANAQVRHARAQVEESKKYTKIIANQAQATLLLNLVDKWNSEESSRQAS